MEIPPCPPESTPGSCGCKCRCEIQRQPRNCGILVAAIPANGYLYIRMGYKQKITFLVFSLLVLQTVFADEIKEQVNVDLVNIFVSATDSKGNFISDLKPEELVLKENGKPQAITNFSRVLADDSDVPLTIAFLIDTSGSMEQYFEVASRAATT